MQVTISKVFRGKQETKYGEKDKVAIKIEEGTVTTTDGKEVAVDDQWLSTFNTDGTGNYAENVKVDIDITENKGYLNFKPVGGGGASAPSPDLAEMKAQIEKLNKAVFKDSADTPPATEGEPDW